VAQRKREIVDHARVLTGTLINGGG
jgi:hypothetical protein